MKFVNSGDFLYPVSDNQPPVLDTIPANVYNLRFEPLQQKFFLEFAPTPVLPPKIYGNVVDRTEKILHTFSERPSSTGILLYGLKGTGKTLLSKNICITALERGVPVISVSEAFSGPLFDTFIHSIEQPVVILVDEFEKIYSTESQKLLLSLLDGAFSSQKLFLFTSNERYSISNFMLNRPGRIFYAFEYDRIEDSAIVGYLDDNVAKEDVRKILLPILQDMGGELSFDILKAVSEEVNRYPNVNLSDLLGDLNIPLPTSDVNVSCELEFFGLPEKFTTTFYEHLDRSEDTSLFAYYHILEINKDIVHICPSDNIEPISQLYSNSGYASDDPGLLESAIIHLGRIAAGEIGDRIGNNGLFNQTKYRTSLREFNKEILNGKKVCMETLTGFCKILEQLALQEALSVDYKLYCASDQLNMTDEFSWGKDRKLSFLSTKNTAKLIASKREYKLVKYNHTSMYM